MGNFKKYWWKLLGIILVAFSVVKSFTTPLSPGIGAATPTSVTAGPAIIRISGYAAHYKAENTSFWLAANGRKFIIPGKVVHIENDQEAEVLFNIPAELPSNSLDIYSYSEQDATGVYPGLIYAKGVKVTPGLTNATGNEITIQEMSSGTFPFRSILYESIRNLNFHVTMWFALLACMLVSVVQSVRYLSGNELRQDRNALESVKVGLLFGFLGLVTGSVWARFTWGDWWVDDVKLQGAAVSVLIYLAYLVLRSSINEEQKRARIVAVYNIFAFVMLIVFIQVIPRLKDSLHPGNGGNPAFSQYDLDNNLRAVFYPAALGWILIGLWISQIRSRMSHINYRTHHHA